MASFNFTSAMPDVGTSFTFGSWVCIPNECGGFNSHLADPRESKASAPTPYRDIDAVTDGFGRIRLSDLIGSYASCLKAISHPRISDGDLLAGIDQVDSRIVGCIKLAEAALQHSDNLGPLNQNRSVIPHHPLADTGDIFSSTNRVGQNITACIKLAETTLRCSDSKELEASMAIFDHDLDDFIDALDELPPPGPN
jgi:hypothetical protein